MRVYCTPPVLSETCLPCDWYFLHVIQFRLAICKCLMLNKGFSASVDLAVFLLDQWHIVLLIASCVWSPHAEIFPLFSTVGHWIMSWNSNFRRLNGLRVMATASDPIQETLPVVLGLSWVKQGNLIINFCWLKRLDEGFKIMRSSWKLSCILMSFRLRIISKEPN